MARSKRRTPDRIARSDASQQDGRPVQNLTPGGATNQVLAKASAADGDAAWVTLAASVPPTRQIISGAGLIGGGDLSVDRTLAVGAGTGITVNADDVAVNYGTSAITACVGNDARLSDSRTPTAHAASHLAAGSDPLAGLSPSQITGTAVVQSRQVAGHALSADVAIAAADLTNGVTGSGAIVLAVSPALTGSPVAPTQTPKDNSTKIATTAYVENAVLGQNFKEACKYGTTAPLPTVTYSNGSSGVGATLTAFAFGALAFDGSTPSVGDRVLIKNQASGLQNGIYTVTVVGGVATLFVLTRATDADQASDLETGDSSFITNGTTLSATTWAYTGIDSPTMGTTALTFVQTAGQGSFSAGDGIAITGNSIAVTADVERTTNKNAANGYAGLSAGSKLTGSQQTYGTAANTACEGNDARLSDARAPTAHNVLSASHGDTLAAAVVRGSLIVGNATPKWSALAIGAAARVLRSDGSDAAWSQVALTTDVTGTLPAANGGTGLATYAVGDLLYASGATALSKLAAVAANQVLVSAGVTTAPVWSATPTVTSLTATGALVSDSPTFVVDATNHRVGFGQATPLSPIHVASSDGTVRTIRIETADAAAAGNAGRLDIIRERGTLSSKAAVQNGDVLGTIAFIGWGGSANDAGAYVSAFVSAAPGAGDMPTTLGFYTSADGSSAPTLNMALTHEGKLGLVNAASAPGAAVHVSVATTAEMRLESTNNASLAIFSLIGKMSTGTAQRWNIGLNAGAADGGFAVSDSTGAVNPFQIERAGVDSSIYIKSTGVVRMAHYGAGTATFDASGNISSVSDERMKDIDGPFDAGLDAVIRLEPIFYHYNKESALDMTNRYAGFSAQNMLAYIPEAIGKNSGGLYSFNVIPVVAALVNAVKELVGEIDDLRATCKLPAIVRGANPLKGDDWCIISPMLEMAQ